ncbi:serine/threonine protein kinase [Mesorhizobium sp. M1E.F.Ca.ET.045.02.1.1]|uniref:serine/threonine-protein kinase n=1 Tax=Mesorhizobium sp. M1E.F.Ca.ET.045.02.1.1 TaxID=2493672 RepID=UPI000F761CA1|nr:serine/threonine-protein kinase [Mesorhizobium sp. M1E.F.Ca.ET.045.02.1.1]AZO25457.1 serine/threonine protein kinase [Mesorhizobium sp. M1E.F.Ca.ET.045.02.1.1]
MSDDDKTRISPNLAYAGVGTQLSGIYELDERIASGGMGEVYRGHNIQTGDHVAIKIVLPEFARDQTILSLFRKEASILNHLSHDAVVRYHVFTIDPGIGRPYLAMEFVDGQSLFDVMRRGPMPTPDVRRLCHRLASGLSAVHQAGAVHRDLSPDNIILPGGRVERAKIIDFGIARSANVGGETLIGGKFAGKYNYVSPEQLGLFGGEVSEQSDIYSLGLVLAAALRGKPLDMSGSQFEVVEKRRTVPDLSDIDPDFRALIEAMLQPDPQDRPASMAEIARATRDEDLDATLPPPAAFGPRERSGLPRAGWTAAPDAGSQASTVPGEQRFVPHVRPAHLSEPRPSPAATPPRAATAAVQKKASRTPAIAVGAVAALAIVASAGLYFSGVMSPQAPATEKLTPLAPKPAPKPVADASRPKPTAPAEAQPEATKPDSSATIEPAKPVAPALPQPEDKTVQQQAEAETEQKPAQPAETPVPPPGPEAPPATEVQEPAQKTSPALQPESPANNNQAQAPQPAEAKPAQPPTEKLPTPAPAPKAAENQKPAPPAGEPPTAKASGPSQAEGENTAAQEAKPPATKPSASDLIDALSKLPKPKAPSPAENQAQAPPAGQPKVPEAASQPETPSASAQPAPLPQPGTKEPQNTDVAINLPKPGIPPTASAQRASWVRDFSGGDCFYASLTSATDSAAAIEGFGTAVQPFEQMLNDFQSKFHLEPDISVRLIDQPQCEVTRFLRFLDRSGAEKPQLVLDRMSVPDGSPISGTLATRGGLISNVMLIDHKGIAFNLDDRMVAQPGKATFNIPIGLGAADKAAGKAVPQIMLAITGPRDIQAAMFSRPTPASELLPKILEEIGTDGAQFSATAKYFRLGG